MQVIHWIGIAFSLLMLGVLGYIVWVNVGEYRKTDATKPTWKRLLDTAKASETILLHKFLIGLSAMVAQLDSVCDVLNLPELKNFIDNWIGNPRVLSLIVLVIALLTIKVRLRPASKDPV